MTTPDLTLASALEHHKAGRLREAERLYHRLLKTDPDNIDAWHMLGLIEHQEGRHKAASDHIGRAIQLYPGSSVMHSNLGITHRMEGKQQESIACFIRALDIDPGNATACCQLGRSYKILGETEKAENYQRSLQLDPQHADAYMGLGELSSAHLYKFSGNDLGRMKALIDQPGCPLTERKLLHYALANHFHIKGDSRQAFQHYEAANNTDRLIAEQTGGAFRPVEYRSDIDRVIAAYNEGLFGRKCGLGLDTEAPVFIVGMPRSGTTLVEQILDSHPRVHGAGELKYIQQIVTDLPGKLAICGPYPECVSGLDASHCKWFARQYLQRLENEAGDAKRIVDKMPENYYHLGLIALLFPKASIIHCTRDPMDTCLSCYCNDLKLKYASDLAHLGLVYRQFQRLMEHWHKVLPLPILEVAYEDLVADPESKARELVEFTGLPWDPACARPHENAGAVITVSALQVRRPVYTSSVKRWKKYAAYLKPLTEALNNPL